MIISANKISIDFKDTEYGKDPGVSVQNAREGSVSDVGTVYTKDCTVQKDVGKGIVYTDTGNEQSEENITKMIEAGRFDPADFISWSMTGEDAADIEDEGSLLEQYEAGTLERAIERVKSQRRQKEDSLDEQTEKSRETKEFYDEMERRIQEAAQLALNVPGISEAAAKYLLESGHSQEMDVNGTPDAFLTVSNLRNSGAAGNAAYIECKADFEEVRAQAESIIAESGAEVNEETIQAAKWLYQHDVPLTARNIGRFLQLEQLKEAAPETLEERITDEVRDGVLPEEADLTHISRAEAEVRLKELTQTDDEILRRAFPENTSFISAKRQLEEIRLTMTIDAARVMENKGIHLDVTNLVQIVDELRAMERKASEEWLREAGVPTEAANVEQMSQTLRAREDIMAAPAAVLGQTIAQADTMTLQETAAAGNLLRSQMEAASESYEAVGTEVRRDLGDNIHKAFSNVDDILKDLGLEPTAVNERAVRILAYNRMALTAENIQSMKEYDSRVTTLMNNLKPAVVAELIRRRENPLEMNLTELSEKVQDISDEIVQEDISFRKYLWKLDHSGSITPEERKSMIGIYRLLDKVEKSDGAVIGQVIKDGRELSFSSLLSAVRTRKAEGLDQTVDDDFGGLEQIISGRETISDQISAAFGGSMASDGTVAYGGRVVSRLQKELAPAVLRNRDDLMDAPLESILDECQGDAEAQMQESRYYEEMAEDIRRIAAEGDSQLMEWLKSLELPDSMANIHLMKAYVENGGGEFIKRYTPEESEEILEHFDDAGELEEIFEKAEERIETELSEQKKNIELDYNGIQDIVRMANSVSFYRQLRNYSKYEVPIYTEDGDVVACSVTLRSGGEKEKGTVDISLDFPGTGALQATFKVAGDRVSGFITSEGQAALEFSRQLMDVMEKDLEMDGFTMEREDFARGRRNSFHFGDKATETTDNQSLYQVAKRFIQIVKRKENEV